MTRSKSKPESTQRHTYHVFKSNTALRTLIHMPGLVLLPTMVSASAVLCVAAGSAAGQSEIDSTNAGMLAALALSTWITFYGISVGVSKLMPSFARTVATAASCDGKVQDPDPARAADHFLAASAACRPRKVMYSKDFLLQFQQSNFERPDGLPSWDELVPAHATTGNEDCQ